MNGEERLQELFLDFIDGMNESALFAKHEQLWNLMHTLPEHDRDHEFIEWCYATCDERIRELATEKSA